MRTPKGMYYETANNAAPSGLLLLFNRSIYNNVAPSGLLLPSYLSIPSRFRIKVTKPEVSNSNVHGHIHGRWNETICNTGSVEEHFVNKYFSEYSSTPPGVA